jgi:hypothetical protein
VNQPTKPIRLGNGAAASVVCAALLVVGCGGPEGAGTVHIAAAKEAAERRGITVADKRAPAAVKLPTARRAGAPVARVKPQRGGHK